MHFKAIALKHVTISTNFCSLYRREVLMVTGHSKVEMIDTSVYQIFEKKGNRASKIQLQLVKNQFLPGPDPRS